MASYNFQQIAASWIAKNNPDGVRQTLINEGIIANNALAGSLTENQLAGLLYQYYVRQGAGAYAALLSKIPVNENLSATENAILEQSIIDVKTILSVPLGAPENINNGLSLQSAKISNETVKSVAKTFWDLIVGGSSTVISPDVTTTTKSSPLTIGLIIGGIAIVGILAWVILKS